MLDCRAPDGYGALGAVWERVQEIATLNDGGERFVSRAGKAMVTTFLALLLVAAASCSATRTAVHAHAALPPSARSGVSGVGSTFEFVSRIDGAKRLRLAVVAVSAIALARRAGPLPAWTVYPTVCWRSP